MFLTSAETVIFGQVSAVFFTFEPGRSTWVGTRKHNLLKFQDQADTLSGTCFAEGNLE